MDKKILDLISELNKLPSVGKKSAEKIGFQIMKRDNSNLVDALNNIKNLKECKLCNNVTSNDLCEICNSHRGESKEICVVTDIKDLYAIENSKIFNGRYFVLGNEINPSKGISPEDINIEKLIEQLDDKCEVILATNPTIQGELTAKYIAAVIEGKTNNVTRLSNGIPMGANIDYIDAITLGKSFKNRRKVGE